MVPMGEQPALMMAFLRSAALGAAGAGTASASTARRGTFRTAITAGSAGFCAIAEGASQPVRMLEDPQQNSSPATWAYPTIGSYQQILNGNLSLLEPLCVQLDHAKSNEVNEVIEARCVHATYQEWAPIRVAKKDPGTDSTDLYEFRSDWDQKLRLRYNTSHHMLDAVACASPNTLNYAQDFTGSPGSVNPAARVSSIHDYPKEAT
jgi:hypothetical protein